MKKFLWLPISFSIVLLLAAAFFWGQKTGNPGSLPKKNPQSAETQQLKAKLNAAGIKPQEAKYWNVIED